MDSGHQPPVSSMLDEVTEHRQRHAGDPDWPIVAQGRFCVVSSKKSPKE